MRTDPYKEAEQVTDRLTTAFVWVGIGGGLAILSGWGYVVVHFARKFW